MTPIEELCQTINQMVIEDNFKTEASMWGLAMLKKYAPGLWNARTREQQ